MNELMQKNTMSISISEIMRQNVMDLSIYDDSLPSKILKEAFSLQIDNSKKITQKIYQDVIKNTGTGIAIPEQGKEKVRLVADVSDEFMDDYKNDVIKLAKEKDHIVAQIKNDNKYGPKLPIKEETYMDGPDSLTVQNALQLQAIQKSIEEISEQIKEIDKNVKEVLQGLQNDRLGLYYSGVALFIEAYSTQNDNLRRELLSQSIKTLSDSIFQLTMNLKSDIQYLADERYNIDKKHKHDLIIERINNINESFMAIHQATILKAAIYCLQGELKTMAIVLNEYEKFITGTIVENAEKLSQCDPNDNGKIDGIWKKRANLQLNISNVMSQLQNQKEVMYIQCSREVS